MVTSLPVTQMPGVRFPVAELQEKLDYLDTLAEWLRRQPAKLMGFARTGSNPVGVDHGSGCVAQW